MDNADPARCYQRINPDKLSICSVRLKGFNLRKQPAGCALSQLLYDWIKKLNN